MRMISLAFLNFRSSFKNYLSLIISLSFTILILLNFQNIIYSDAFALLGARNKDYVDMIVQAISFVLACFMFFFVWYSTNVFLTRRKREIGIYVFMGLSNQKIGKLYAMETALIGLTALVLGVFFGMLTTGLFQMILLALSDIAADISFQFSIRPVLTTAGSYLGIYLIFVIKGYLNIVRSSVLSMISGTKQNEYVRRNTAALFMKTVLGVGALGAGFFLAVKESDRGVIGNVFLAVVLVVVGVYLLFGGLIPFVFQGLAGNKRFLYGKQRCLWINSVIFRMKKNYRTYAMVCVLVLCSVTALATGFAMRSRYDNIVFFQNTYTFQIISSQTGLDGKLRQLIQENTGITYGSEIAVTGLDESQVRANENYGRYAVVSYSELKKLAQDVGLAFELEEPGDDEVIRASHLYLLTLITDRDHLKVTIGEKVYRQVEETNVPYLGNLQDQVSFYVVNDEEYKRLVPLGQELYCYNYRIENQDAFTAVKETLNEFISEAEEEYMIGGVFLDTGGEGYRKNMEWIKVLYSLCIFMFMVFILASGSIMFMKLYNDGFEEKERYLVMKKLGISERTLRKSIANELGTAYVLPFVIMSISSRFSVHALENMMHMDLRMINLLSVLVVFIIFLSCYLLSVFVYWRNVEI